jgi:hypothetical protein
MSHGTSENGAPVDHTEAHLRERAENLTALAAFAKASKDEAEKTVSLLALALASAETAACGAWAEFHKYRARSRS